MLTPDEHERIRRAINAANLVAFIDDIEDFTWEVVWAYSQGLPAPSRDRKKDLFDVVDPGTGIGWSAKTLVWSLASSTCEFVIQRADVITKRDLLGFPDLTLDSDPQLLGEAVMAHWRMKIQADAIKQGVEHTRLALLIKSKDRRSLVPYEEVLPVPVEGETTWQWSSADRKGLLGSFEGKLKYRWYPNQKQLFETFTLDPTRQPIRVDNTAKDLDELFACLGV